MINLLLYSLVIFLFPFPAYAYLDPGFGSLILQAIIGFFALDMILKLHKKIF